MKDLFWLMVSEASVHGCFGPVEAQYIMAMETHVRGRLTCLMMARKERERERKRETRSGEEREREREEA
jgi:hypothetical protein